MPKMLDLGKELLRFNSSKDAIEYSINGGRTWVVRSTNRLLDDCTDLFEWGDEILACTPRGICYSRDNGKSWTQRYTSTSTTGTFQTLHSDGSTLLAETSKGLYYSRQSGRDWTRKR